MKKIVMRIVALLVIVIAGWIAYMVLTDPVGDEALPPPPPPAQSSMVVPEGNRLVIEVAGQTTGTIEIELFDKLAPGHVARIKALAAAGRYDNVVFHRVIDGFMAQTGDVQFGIRDGGNLDMAGMGGSESPDLKAEFSDTPFEPGVVGMARARDPDSANSQFFIMLGSAPHLNGQYTAVGRVVSGMDVVRRIRKGDPARNGAVDDPDYMARVTVKAGG